ncbi:glutamyl-tRNA reductase [Thermosporothrix hazakensis]|jgi:glutamyl-tRNA reductase|uniref:Glutamyl-tRNA reductase n=2 Tax=Thermosporothrix TaxID=768650 RepID=A0A326U7G1_THEHA|nr:glutamyl-tRNA reductase [Thermosporothrix hazakensis]PZW30647.1 glutamyl-tRNA reductase [Thermosporothrix hazakensis]BBH91363.1 glutamyl-tRNA reductase [Thermosporothrix sp. COM3]GCE49510.1 glutamyl-tRNA reductase [Thermosporothrix hazakensis]
MQILVVGVDHTTASISLRERLSCSSRQIAQVLHSARQVFRECVLLSTCNRVELYAVSDDAERDRPALLRILAEQRQVPLEELEAHAFVFTGREAASHLFAVTCGLHSLVPGEPQIQGQVVDALEVAQGGGFSGPVLSALFRAAITTGKRARSETGISRNAASISHVAVQLARHLFPALTDASVLLVGSGQMSELAARNLYDNGARRLVIVNRTFERAIDLVQSLNASHRSFDELEEALVEADVVISSTRAPHALITRDLMQRVMQRRNGRSLLLIDIALPRDIEPDVASLPDVYLYNLDDLHMEVERGIRLRLQEVEHVKAIVAEETQQFERWLASLSVVDTISDLRGLVDQVRRLELERTLRQLPSLSEREIAAVQELTHRLVNKFLHMPTRRLKDAAADGQGHVYAEAMRYLFALEQEDEKHNNRNASKQARNDTDQLDHRAASSPLAHS